MLTMISDYIVPVLVAFLLAAGVTIGVLLWKLDSADKTIVELNTQLGVVAAMSQQQEVKIVEAKKVEEKLKVVYQDKIKVVTEYVYDENKSDCDNAIDLMRNVF